METILGILLILFLVVWYKINIEPSWESISYAIGAVDWFAPFLDRGIEGGLFTALIAISGFIQYFTFRENLREVFAISLRLSVVATLVSLTAILAMALYQNATEIGDLFITTFSYIKHTWATYADGDSSAIEIGKGVGPRNLR